MNRRESLQENSGKIWNPIFIKMFIINILINFSICMVNPLSATYADFLGATATIVGLVSSLFAMTALIFKLVSAPAADAFNKKNILIGSIFILFVSFLGYSISKTISMLIISRLLTGVGLAFVPICSIPIVSASLPAHKMATGIGYFALGPAISQAIAPAIGLKLVDRIGYNYTFSILAVLLIFTIAFTATLDISFKKANKFRITINSIIAKEVLIPAVILFLLNMTFGNVNAFLILFGEKRGVNSNIGYFFTVLASTMIFTRPLIGKLADKYGTVKVIIPSMLCFAVSFLLISYSKTLPMFLFAGFISAFGYVGCWPALMAVCMRLVPDDRRGAASSTSYIALDLSNLIGPVLAGVIIEVLGYAYMWQFMIFPILIAIIITIQFRDRISQVSEDCAPERYVAQEG